MEDGQQMKEQELEAHLRYLGLSEEDVKKLVDETFSKQTPAVSQVNEDDEEEMAFLINCFPTIPRSTLKAKLIENKHDLDATSEVLLNYDLIKNESGPQFFDKRLKKQHKSQTKREKKVNINRTQDLELLVLSLSVSQAEAERLYDTHDQSVSKVLQNYFKSSAWDMRTISTLVTELDGPRPRVETSAAKRSASAAPSQELLDSFGDQTITKSSIKQMKESYLRRMEALLSQAHNHGQRIGTRHLAAEYRQEAADLMNKLKELQVLEFHVKSYNQQASVIDFHGMTVSVALALCEDKVDHWLVCSRDRTLELVTGAGLHSSNGVPRIKNAVRRYLDQRKLNYEELPGSFVVHR